MTTAETWLLIVLLVAGPGLAGYLIGRMSSRRPPAGDDE